MHDAADGLFPVADERAEARAARLRDLPGVSVAPAFPPVEERDRPDPYNAFVCSFLADSAVDGPLAGYELAVKDNVAVNGVRMTCGTDCFAWTPEADATVVERLRAAGAGLEATTNMDAFAFGTTGEWSAHGATENPAVAGAVPGGSSSGSGAAVAGGLVDAAIGTDTGGSVRIPASFCGVVGVKPTFGLVPRTGVADLAPSFDTVGVLARDVETATRVLDVVAGQDVACLPSLPAPYRLNVRDSLDETPDHLSVGVPEEFMAAADPGVEAVVEESLATLLAVEGVHVEDVAFPEHEAAVEVNDAQTLMEFAALLRRGAPIGDGRAPGYREALREAWAAGLPTVERVREGVAMGAALLDDPGLYGRTWDTRHRVIRRQESLFGEVDVLVTPTTTMTAPDVGTVVTPGGPSVVDTCRNTALFNVTGAPAVSIPVGEANGRPVGLQVVAPPGADGFLMRVAKVFEDALA